MKKSLISILVLIMVLSSVFMLACKEPTEEVIPAPAPEGVEAESLGEYGKVTLSFGAFSDIHFSSVCDKQVKEYYPKALADIMKQTGNRLSAVTVSGDFSEGFAADYDTLIQYTIARVGDEVPLIASYGNHEGNGKHFQYEAKFGKPVDNVTVVNGYNFICVGAHSGDTYTEEQAEWLDEQLATMTAADPDKPVFILIHHPVKGTHDDWTQVNGNPELQSTLVKYPQAFVLCGHQHQPFSAESLWKGEYISFRNSYLRNETEGQYAIIRVTDLNYVVIKKYSIKPGDIAPTYMGDDYVINLNEFYDSKEDAA